MPDVTRSDSQRSDTSNRPRVSFNRDVHVKRIVSRDNPHVSGVLSGNGAGHLVALPIRKERLGNLSKKQLAEEAAKVIHQVDKVDCTTSKPGVVPDKFYTLPARRKHRKPIAESPHSSQERLNVVNRRRSEELGVTSVTPPKKPPRTFASVKQPKQKNSLLKLFRPDKESEPKKSNLRRSVSDASNLKSKTSFEDRSNRKRSGSESEENQHNSSTKKTQLSPIIEVSTPCDDYFTAKKNYFGGKDHVDSSNNGNLDGNRPTPRKKWGRSEANGREQLSNENEKSKALPEVVIIDVDEAKSANKKLSGSSSFKEKLKFLTLNHPKKPSKKKKKAPLPKQVSPKPQKNKRSKTVEETRKPELPEERTSPKIQQAIKSLEESFERSREKSPEMIHSSQQPVDRIPLTRGYKVDTMIRRLNRDKSSPPPKTNTILVTPTVTVSHNNNQPFSYTKPRDTSPEPRSKSPQFKASSPIIYAQVVVGDSDVSGANKQTVHTVYTSNKKQFPHSDSDEGLGYEESSGFQRKYTQFGDEKKQSEVVDEEFPITPKFKSIGTVGPVGGFDYEYSNAFVDSSARGRGDGMDSRRRESLTEPFDTKLNDGFNNLSYRRDLLESRINRRLGDKLVSPEISPNQRVNKYVQETTSRYYRHGSASPVGFTEKYTSEMKMDRNGERHFVENRSKTFHGDQNERKHYPEDYSYDRYEGEPKSLDSQVSDYRSSPENINNRKSYYTSSHNDKDYRSLHHNRYKSKGEKILLKDRDHYKSNPEIHRRGHETSYRYEDHSRFASETYHDSLRRQKHDNQDSPKRPEKYFDDRDRKDKFGDSGIENDFRRDSGENVRTPRDYNQTYRSNNESEDEGFASSLLIASERQHTEDNFLGTGKKHKKEYDSDRDVRGRSKDDPGPGKYGNEYKKSTKHEYIPRERSIDDGSHFDPRIDKDLDEKRGTLKVDKKPPKPAKMSSLKKMKQLFTRDSSKKSKKEKVDVPLMVTEENLRARYKEYRGSMEALSRHSSKKDLHSEPNRREEYRESKRENSFDSRRDNYPDSRLDNHSDNSQNYDYSSRRRLSTPSPSPTSEIRETREMRESRESREAREAAPPNPPQPGKHDSWFKSLDRFSLKKKQEKIDNKENIKENIPNHKPPPVQQTKSLRFFGDTDLESSNGSVRRKSSLKSRPAPSYKTPTSTKTRSQSTRNLHNISEEFNNSDVDTLKKYNKSYKSMQNIPDSDRELKGSRTNLKPPISPNRRLDSTLKSKTENRNRKRRNEISSVESSTEGDSSQQSQRSVVYLHAATVGDIPGPGYLSKNGRRAASKEELISNGSTKMQPQVKTLSRSFSMLAPWKPRHGHEGYDIDYSQPSKPAKPMKNGSSKSGGKTAKEISNQKKMSSQNLSTLSRKSKSKENVSHTLNRKSREEPTKSSSTTLYKKKDRQFKDNNRYSRDDKKISSKSMSVESLGGGDRSSLRSKEEARAISRSVSMPRDPEKSAGWFKMNKKHKKTLSTQRL